jgi:hypothetical protein
MDHMLKMMEDYTNNLETIIEERTREITDEKARVDHLLYNMLPAYVKTRCRCFEVCASDTAVTILSPVVQIAELSRCGSYTVGFSFLFTIPTTSVLCK